ncbi:MAG: AAA family ATPase, partial [Candidatus Methanomethylophilaceae archaeon]|nr:AAA family ATPase [Candidatus Methanomethylophilaceae archaeon]
MFRRKIYDAMKSWKEENSGRCALMIEGARRVGKSTIIEEFVRNEYASYIIIRFEKVGEEVKELFRHMNDLDRFFLYLQQFYGVELQERKSAIVFDEVQLFPLARQSIKILVEDGRYDYYETGSLISIKENIRDILIPSEEDTMYMYPMDFEEFLWARGDTMTMPFIRSSFEKLEPAGDEMHEFLMEKYRTYMIVGGMPQAVQTLIDANSFASVERTKKLIL